MAIPKPTIVFVPGAWHGPSAYANLASRLEAYGYPSVSITLPSVGGSPPTFDFAEDIATIQATVSSLVEEGKDVILVAHSYSGQLVGEMPEDLSKKAREKRKLQGGLVRIVFVMAFLVPEGFQAAPKDDTSTMYAFIKADTEVSSPSRIPLQQTTTIILKRTLPDKGIHPILTSPDSPSRPASSLCRPRTPRRSGITIFPTKKPLNGPPSCSHRASVSSGASLLPQLGDIFQRPTFCARMTDHSPSHLPRCSSQVPNPQTRT